MNGTVNVPLRIGNHITEKARRSRPPYSEGWDREKLPNPENYNLPSVSGTYPFLFFKDLRTPAARRQTCTHTHTPKQMSPAVQLIQVSFTQNPRFGCQ